MKITPFLLLIAFLIFPVAGFSQPQNYTPDGALPGICQGSPGNTVLSFHQQCQSLAGVIYACNNPNGCAVAEDLVAQAGSGGPPTGPAGGALSGTFPNPALATGVSLPTPSIGASPITETWTVGAGGVTANTLVILDSSNPAKVVAATGSGAYGVALSTVAANGTVEVARYGTVTLLADNAVTAGDLIIPGTGTVTYGRDSGQTNGANISISTRIIGVARTSASGGATFQIELTPAHFGTQHLPSVRDSPYNAIPDLVHISDAQMSSGSGVLTTAHVFPSSWVGKTCVVGGAGATVSSYPRNLRTTIASIDGSGHATMADNSVTAIKTYTITAATGNGVSPIVLTVADTTGLVDGEAIDVVGVLGDTAANSKPRLPWQIAAHDSTTITLPPWTIGNGAYTSGGTIGIPADCGTNNTPAFVAIKNATSGSGFRIPGDATVGAGYLLSNFSTPGMSTGASGGVAWSGTIAFDNQALVVCDTVSTTGLDCFQVSSGSHNVNIIRPNIDFAGNPFFPRAAGSANALEVLSSSNVSVDTPTVFHAASNGISSQNNNGISYYNISLLGGSQANFLISFSDQDLSILGGDCWLSGDYCYEIDTKDSVNPNNNTATATGLKSHYSYGGVLADSKQGLIIAGIEGDHLCDGGVVVSNTLSATPPSGNAFSGVVLNSVGRYAAPLWVSTSACTTGVGKALRLATGGDTRISQARITNTLGSPLSITGSTAADLQDVSYSNNYGPMVITTSTVNLSNFEMDTSRGTGYLSVASSLVTGNHWVFKDVCTDASCSGLVADFEANTQQNVSDIVINDDQMTPTGNKIKFASTVTPSTVAKIQGYITNGTSKAPVITLDAETVLDPQSGGVVPRQVVASLDLINNNGNISNTTLLAGSGVVGGSYAIQAVVTVTTAAGTSSVMPTSNVSFNAAETGAAISKTITATASSNATTTQQGGVTYFTAQAGTNIVYATGSYSSVGSPAMLYSLHMVLEYLGP